MVGYMRFSFAGASRSRRVSTRGHRPHAVRSSLRLVRRLVNDGRGRSCLEQPIDLLAEAGAPARYAERLPGRCETCDALAERIPVVLLVEIALLGLEEHVVPVRLLSDLPLAEAPALVG